MDKKYGYVRISKTTQNMDRQYQALKKYEEDNNIKLDCIFEDKQSGGNFDRPQYQYLKSVIKPGDMLLVKELDRFGRNYEDIKKELGYFYSIGVKVIILDIPLMQIEDNSMSRLFNNLIIELLSYIAEKERIKLQERVKEGIRAAQARGVKFGRPEAIIPKDFERYYKKWENKELKVVEMAKIMGVTRQTIHRWRVMYEKEKGIAS